MDFFTCSRRLQMDELGPVEANPGSTELDGSFHLTGEFDVGMNLEKMTIERLCRKFRLTTEMERLVTTESMTSTWPAGDSVIRRCPARSLPAAAG